MLKALRLSRHWLLRTACYTPKPSKAVTSREQTLFYNTESLTPALWSLRAFLPIRKVEMDSSVVDLIWWVLIINKIRLKVISASLTGWWPHTLRNTHVAATVVNYFTHHTSQQVFCHHSWLKLPQTSISFHGTCNQTSNFTRKRIMKMQLIGTCLPFTLNTNFTGTILVLLCSPLLPKIMQQ